MSALLPIDRPAQTDTNGCRRCVRDGERFGQYNADTMRSQMRREFDAIPRLRHIEPKMESLRLRDIDGVAARGLASAA